MARNQIDLGSQVKNTLPASKLAVRDPSNLFFNPVFDNGSSDCWTNLTSVETAASSLLASGCPTAFAGYRASPANGSTVDVQGTGFVSVTPGETYYYAFDCSAVSGTTANVSVYWRSYNADRSSSTPRIVGTAFSPTTTWTTYSGSFVIPTGVYFIFAGPRATGNNATPAGGAAFTNFKLRRMASSELVPAGTIAAAHLAAELTPTDAENKAGTSTTKRPTVKQTADAFGRRALYLDAFQPKMDGTDDSTATSAARTSVSSSGTYGVIKVGPGFFSPGTPSGGPTLPVLWQLQGNKYSDGSPVAYIGGDIVETYLPSNGGKFFGQGSTTSALGDMHTVSRTVSHSGGNAGVAATSRMTTNVTGNPSAFVFGVSSSVYDNTTTTNQSGNFVGVYAQYFRYSGGTPGWAFAAETQDYTNKLSSETAPLIGAEVLLKCNRPDDANRRVIVDAVIGKALTGAAYNEQAVAAWGYRLSGFVGDVSQSYCKVGFSAESAILDAAFDASRATYVGSSAVGYRVGQNKKIDFSNDSTRTLMWNSGGALQYSTPNGLALEITDTGTATVANFVAAGQVKGATALFTALPTSASGLPSGSLWRDATASNAVKVVP